MIQWHYLRSWGYADSLQSLQLASDGRRPPAYRNKLFRICSQVNPQNSHLFCVQALQEC